MNPNVTSKKPISGFTLIETIIYVGLFGIMFTGIFISIYPFFTGAERLSRNVAAEGETAFILAKIQYALTTTTTKILSPAENATSSTLIIADSSGTKLFTFTQGTATAGYCPPPRTICGRLDFATSTNATTTLSAERVAIDNFTVVYHKIVGEPRYLEISFTANNVRVGTSIYYLPMI